MLTQSKEVQNAWRASQRTLDIKVMIDGKTYGATDVNSLKYDSGAYNGDTFAIGSTYSNTVQIEFSHLIEGLKLGMEVRPSIGIKTSSGYIYEPLGVFIISSEIKMDRNNNLTTVSASDRFCGLEGTYVSKLTYPAKVLDVIAEICAQSGVKANTADLARLPHQEDLPAPITGQSYRKALGWIAQLYVGYALFDRQGLFTIRTISEPNYELDPSQYEQAGLTKNEAAYKINGIQCQVTLTTKTRDGESTEETKNYQAGDATGSQIKLENNIMTPQRLNDIWEQLKDITFYPFSLNWFGNPAVEAGDWLRLEDKQGNSFVVPNSSYTLDFNGGLSATSKADQTTSSDQMVPWQGSVAQVIKELQLRRVPDGTVVFPPSVTEPPTNAKFNDIWFKKNGNSTELWIFEKQDDGSGKWIRKDLSDDEIKKKVTEAQQGLNQAKADIINNKQKADADIENLNKSIEVNKKVADESLQKLNDSVTNLQGQYDNSVVPNLNKVMADASDALQKYISAQNSIADLTKQAQQQGKDIADVSNTVKGLNINYANLAGDVNSTKVDVKGLQTTVGTANGDIAQLKLDAQNLQTMLAGKVDNTTYTNFVNLTNQALNARLTASDLNGYAKTVDVQATANGLKFNIDSVTDRMNNLKASTRNLLFNTEDFQNYGVNGNAKIENISTLTSVPNHPEIIKIAHGWGDYQSAYSDQYVTLEKDKIYWFGFYVCTDNTTQSPYSTMAVYANENNSVANAKCWAYVNTQDYSYYGGKAQNWTWHVYKIIGDGKTYHYWRAEPSNHVQSSYYATGYTLVQSDIAPTEHVNSPEDTKNSLEQLSARITTNSQQFSSYYTKSEADNRTNSAKSDAVNAIKSDSNWQGLSNILTNSGFLQTADGFIQKVQQTTTPMFNGGGINLVQGTSNRWSDSWWNGFNGGTNQTKEVGKFYLSSLNVGDWVTVVVNYQYQNISGNNPSIMLQADGDKTGWDYEIFPGRSWQKLQTSLNLNFGAFKWSFQINENALKNTYLNLNFRVDNAKGGWLQWCNLKIEKGKIATPWSPAPNDLATQSAFSELSQTVQGLRSIVSSNYGDLQTQLSQSSSGIRTDLTNKITGLQTQLTTTAKGLNAKIGAIQVGGRNLLHGTSDSWKSFTVSGWGLFSSASSTNTSTDGYKKGDQFTYSAMIDNNGSHPVSLEAVAFDGNNNGSYNNSELIPAGSKNYRVKVTFAIQENTKYIRTSVMFPNASGANDTIRIKDEQLEEGNLCTQWTPNPDDISNQFTELNATINGLQSTVSKNYGNLQSWIDQTAKAIRGEVTDKVGGLQTQLTQQANNFNVSLQRASMGGGINLALNTSDRWSDSWWNSFNGGGNQTKVITQIKFKNLNAGDWITGSVNYQYQGLSGNNMTINVQGFGNKTAWNGDTFGAPSSQKLSASSNTQWGKFQFSFQVTANMLDQSKNDYYNVQFRVDNAKGGWIQWCYVKFEAGTTATPWSPAPDDKVAKDQILAQINMSAGITLIQNDKIYMDASSTIFSGNAFIPSAAITSLTADKITAGTINGAKVNVINLNANNITAGTLRGSNGEFYLDSGALHVWQNNHDAWIDQNGIHDYDNQGNNVWIKKGCISAYGNTSSVDIRDGEIHLNKKMWVTDNVLASDYGTIAKADNVFNLGTSGLALTGTDGFLLKTSNWNDGTLTRMGNDPITGSGIAGNNSGFMQLAAGKQLFLYAGPMNPSGGFRNLPHLVLDGTVGNEKTELFGYFSSYNLTSLTGPLDGGLNLEDDSVILKSLNGKNGFSANASGVSMGAGDHRLSLGGLFSGVSGDFSVVGNFTVTGSKNAVVPTSRGMAAINAYETAEYYFGDIGETQTNSNGVVTVMIDPYFLETVNTLVPYQVFLTSYGDGNVWVSSRSANNFTVKSSNPNIHFAWEIKAKRKGYENDRMKIVKGVFNNEQY
ncbi:peptidase [Limosilactobacillus reuteri]|uniref:peptidase n=1 Tax=Limosilactobacillus reuteri TaxID=1598 RepID=UPI001E4E3A6B|nr:peptidase [Limosilactobacillus reuteri]MCC4349286.1 peptidase [Limosilactobacillus reuteri]MCC4359677.1 peptidase [Limosilactobacillus reuteri]MCC4407312.1 peptidase [Limosilactobacillus reuteri]MCC4416634.1 peptidase [Limosilactobacillus reuteri]MCC4426086.1 peptidase [Limosilactobacillus reuteri]